MHSLDGGVTPSSAKWVFGIDKDKTERKYSFGIHEKNRANQLISTWSRCTPYEFARRVRSLRHMKKWKMIEGRTFLLYLSAPLFYLLETEYGSTDRKKISKTKSVKMPSIFTTWMHLVKCVRLLSGDQATPIPDVRKQNDFDFQLFLD